MSSTIMQGAGLYTGIDALDDTFYLDTAEASAQYRADFLQDRFRKDLECLYEKARLRFIRIQNNELVQIRQTYAEYYNSLLFCMTESLTGLIRETVSGSSAAATWTKRWYYTRKRQSWRDTERGWGSRGPHSSGQ